MWKIINVKWSHFLASRPCTWRRKIFPQLFVTRCAETRKRNVLSAQRGRKQIMKFSIVWHICCKRWGRWHEILQQYYGRLFCEMQNLNHKTCEVSIPLKQYLFFFSSLSLYSSLLFYWKWRHNSPELYVYNWICLQPGELHSRKLYHYSNNILAHSQSNTVYMNINMENCI